MQELRGGKTPLHWVRDAEIVKLLLDGEADVDAKR